MRNGLAVLKAAAEAAQVGNLDLARVTAAVAARDADGQPLYRFHGHNKPEARTPLKAVVDTAAATTSGATATIRLYDPIDSWGGDWGVSAKEFADVLDALPANVNSIQLNVNSPGGEVWEGIAILNQLRAHPANVTAVVDGVAASAASFIACGVDQVVMAPNSQMMIHDALGICVGNAADMTAFAALLDKISGNIADIYASRSTSDSGTWRTAMRAESWYNADEAVTAGLADRVADTAATAPADAFDLSVFQHAGRDKAPAPAVDTQNDEARIRASFSRRHAMNVRKAHAA